MYASILYACMYASSFVCSFVGCRCKYYTVNLIQEYTGMPYRDWICASRRGEQANHIIRVCVWFCIIPKEINIVPRRRVDRYAFSHHLSLSLSLSLSLLFTTYTELHRRFELECNDLAKLRKGGQMHCYTFCKLATEYRALLWERTCTDDYPRGLGHQYPPRRLRSLGHVMKVDSLQGGGRWQWCGRAGVVFYSKLFRCELDIRVLMMIAFITIKSSLVPLIEGLCAQI